MDAKNASWNWYMEFNYMEWYGIPCDCFSIGNYGWHISRWNNMDIENAPCHTSMECSVMEWDAVSCRLYNNNMGDLSRWYYLDI